MLHRSTADIDYCYIIGDEIRNINPVYKPVKRFFGDGYLLKKGDAASEFELTKTVQQYHSTSRDTLLTAIRIAVNSILIKQEGNRGDQHFI